jgi:hypothetical protein
MSQPDFRGARGSNAGDDFHELWALRQALALFSHDGGLSAVTVEGVAAEDEKGTKLDTWDGVDCTLYYGGLDGEPPTSIVIDQVKYSAAHPEKPWTVARLCATHNKKKDNSVIARLATAFKGLWAKHPALVPGSGIKVRLVSNQPLDAAIVQAFAGSTNSKDDRVRLLKASRLTEPEFQSLAQAIDLTACGNASRFALEENVRKTISEWAEDDARTVANDLLRYMRTLMGPERKGESVTQASLLAHLNLSDRRALFPCPSFVEQVPNRIKREIAGSVADAMMQGEKRVCLHGEGGCGKSTITQDLGSVLPEGSKVIVFDCYGAGRYLNSDGYRHRPRDAFLQLSNDLARELRIPLLLTASEHLNYPRVFSRRLARAAEVVKASGDAALLVIVIDAADNSITAAASRQPAEVSFVHDVMVLGDLPANVRLLVTARTGQLNALCLPREFKKIPIAPFSREETGRYVGQFWSAAPSEWLDDFWHLSGGNPRVQRYAINLAKGNIPSALDFLRPGGKGLRDIFREQLENARRKAGAPPLKTFCASSIALFRPVPVDSLAAVSGLSADQIRDICSDLRPGVRIAADFISFADEDFETFVREEGGVPTDELLGKIADHFQSEHDASSYAASHLGTALYNAGRVQSLLELIRTEQKPVAIVDPVIRRQVQLHRLQLAMKVCRETGNNVDAVLTLLVGADALKTDVAIRRTLVENPDLGSLFAEASSTSRILGDPNEIEHHGPLLFHLVLADARRGDAIAYREGMRQARAWLERRNQANEEHKAKYQHAGDNYWEIGDEDIAAIVEAILRMKGPKAAIDGALRWQPRRVAFCVASILTDKLISAGEKDLLKSCYGKGGVRRPWNVFVLTKLALAGEKPDVEEIAAGLRSLLRHGLLLLKNLDFPSDRRWVDDYYETALLGCEVVAAHGGLKSVMPVLEHFAHENLRKITKTHASDVLAIDLSLRAHVLLQQAADQTATFDTYLIDDRPPEKTEDDQGSRDRSFYRERVDRIKAVLSPVLGIYNARAQAILGRTHTEDTDRLSKAVRHLKGEEWSFSRHPESFGVRTRAARAMATLVIVPTIEHSFLREQCRLIIGNDPLGTRQIEILKLFAHDSHAHETVVADACALAKSIETLRTSADDRIVSLLRISRLLIPLSEAEAKAIFNCAIDIAGELDAESVHELAQLGQLARRGAGAFTRERARSVAIDVATITSDAVIRLDGRDGFPWDDLATALAWLDTPVALAAVARWEDAGVAERYMLLPEILEAGIASGGLGPDHCVALLAMLNHASPKMLEAIAEAAGPSRADIIEEIAREELLRFRRNDRGSASDGLDKIIPIGSAGYWQTQLRATTDFLAKKKTHRGSTAETPSEAGEFEKKRQDVLASLQWSGPFASVAEVGEFVRNAISVARASDAHVWTPDVLGRMEDHVAVKDRVNHLDALAGCAGGAIDAMDAANAIIGRVEKWQDSLAVQAWCQEKLPGVIVTHFQAFCRYYPHQSPLQKALSGAANAVVTTAVLLKALEQHVDSLASRTVYGLAGLIGAKCTPEEAAVIVERFSARLLARIPIAQREAFDAADLPKEAQGGIARFLYAYLSDADIRLRWRAV